MWPNNGFGNNLPFQNNFNPEDFPPPSPFGNANASPGTPLQGQLLFTHGNMMPFGEANGEGFANDFHPEVGLFNEGAFMQNQGQFMSPQPQVCAVQPRHHPPSIDRSCTPARERWSTIPTILLTSPGFQFPTPQFNMLQAATNMNGARPATQINARAAELKAQLLKGREARSGSFTPPVLATKSGNAAKPMKEFSSSMLGSPKPPITAAENREQDLNALISEFSAPRPALDSALKSQNLSDTKQIVSSPEQIPVATSAKSSQASSLASPTKVANPASVETKIGDDSIMKSNSVENVISGAASDISEGEILEDPIPSQPAEEAKKSQPQSVSSNQDEQALRVSRDTPPKGPYSRNSRDESPRREIPSHPKGSSYRSYEERRQDRRYEPEYKSDRKSYHEEKNGRGPTREEGYRKHEDYRKYNGEREPSRRSSREEENSQKIDSNHAPAKNQVSKLQVREQTPPTLADLLPLDPDLREWLEITGYHNTAYRDKILDRRRKLAILDAQRIKLLAEIEVDERGGVPPTPSQQPPSSMLPPPAPSKTGEKQDVDMTSPTTASDPSQGRLISNKRFHSDSEENTERGSLVKVARTDDRNQAAREERPRSSGFGSSRRSSFEHRDGQESSRPRYDDDRNRANSRVREFSPGRRAYESRPPARSRPYESDESHEKDERDERSFSGRGGGGGYHGPPQFYDPNYRGRGRGRGGRGRGRGGPGSGSLSYDEAPAFGSKIATSKPFRDPRGFERGGKAGS